MTKINILHESHNFSFLFPVVTFLFAETSSVPVEVTVKESFVSNDFEKGSYGVWFFLSYCFAFSFGNIC